MDEKEAEARPVMGTIFLVNFNDDTYGLLPIHFSLCLTNTGVTTTPLSQYMKKHCMGPKCFLKYCVSSYSMSHNAYLFSSDYSEYLPRKRSASGVK